MLADDVARTGIPEFIDMVTVEGTHNDIDVRIILGHVPHELRRTLALVDGDNQHFRFPDTGRVQQVRPHRVAEIDLDAELPQHLELLRLVVENHCLEAGGQQDAIDDAAEAAVPGDDHAALLLDLVRLPAPGCSKPRRDELIVNDEKERRQQHRQRDNQQQLLGERCRNDGARHRKREQNETEFAGLGKSERKQPAIGAGDAEDPAQGIKY